MTKLTFHFESPRDVLAKLERDLERLHTAVRSNSKIEIADAFFDLANTGYCIKEWLKKNTNANFTEQDVETYIESNIVLDACRDISNANKHFTLKEKRIPKAKVSKVTLSSSSAIQHAPMKELGEAPLYLEPPRYHVKVILSDGAKYEITEFGRTVVNSWKSFYAAKKI